MFDEKDPDLIDLNPNHNSLRKVVIWRFIVTLISTVIAYFFLNEITSPLALVLVEAVIVTIIHYVFEELWESKYGGKNESSRGN